MAHSTDFIKRAAAYKREGHALKRLQEAFGMPAETYYGRKKKPGNGHFDAKAKRGRKRKTGKGRLKQAL
jgi:hypothetical protein